jgi:hypothetical protein
MSELIGLAYFLVGGVVAGAELYHQKQKGFFVGDPAPVFLFWMAAFWAFWPLIVGVWIARKVRS